MAESYKIYTLHDPDTLDVRYVGFTSKTLKRRLYVHIVDSKSKLPQDHRSCWIRSLLNCGKRPAILLVETVSEENWQDRERFWILHFRGIGCELTNSCDGGNGLINPSIEVREKIRAAHIGRKPSAETRAKIGAARRRWVLSEESRAKISASLRGRVVSAETRAKLSAIHRGKVHSEETRAKIRALKLGKQRSEETRAKMRAANLGKSHSKETRAKISAAHRGRVHSRISIEKLSASKSKPVMNTSTGEIFKGGKLAALALGVSYSTVKKWIRSGKFTRVAPVA